MMMVMMMMIMIYFGKIDWGPAEFLTLDRGADKSLARPGRKKALKHVKDARDFNNVETRAVVKFFFFCKAKHRRKFTPF